MKQPSNKLVSVTPDLTAETLEIEPTAPSTAGMTTKVVKGSLWTLAGQAVPMAVSLVATPFTIRLLGSEAYGVLILVGLIPTYLGFAEFGMSIASTKFASEAYAAGDTAKEAQIIRTAAVIAFLASLPVGVGIFLLSGWLVTLFNVPEHLAGDASLALKFASVTFVVNFLNGIFNTPQLTRLRMDLNTFVSAGFRILGQVAVPVVIFYVGGIAAAIFALMVVSLLTLGAHILVSGNLLPDLFGKSIDRGVIRRLLKFGGGLVVAGIAGIFLVNVEKGILAATVSPKALAYYSIAFTLATMMTLFSSSMIQSLLPAFSQLQSDAKRDQLNALYSRGIRISLILCVPALVFLSLLAKPFFTRWAGPEFGQESTLPFYILAGGLAFNIIAYLPFTAIMATGRTDIFAKLYWAELAPYILLVWFLASRYGAIGAALAWSLRVIADAVFQFVLAKKMARVTF
ncbi:MAG: flippase, partial [Candidatus Binatia bacterium]